MLCKHKACPAPEATSAAGVCVCVSECVCARVHVHLRACVRACVRACARALACMCVRACVRARAGETLVVVLAGPPGPDSDQLARQTPPSTPPKKHRHFSKLT